MNTPTLKQRPEVPDTPAVVQQPSNPQPCGYFNDRSRECHCTQPMIQRYMGKIFGPLLDRIDIHIDVPALMCPR